ncbi:glycosyltransferase family 2 protein [Agromyces larvae]|uniref:Glycosyltransferase family 2 protein n=1 Tax=Agromyces larvae TaxID=2929802 RepID=A0ABY4BYF1_9MICO|nr:glycosyltransferase family 2 protein [Agromyces larvae]UOE42748.1 glycosyltransferase family 2 protein [Agromyces larvae]
MIIVTYQSANDLATLITSLRAEAQQQRVRVIVADNSSQDETLHVAREFDDVVVFETGGNLGYAGGINIALGQVGETDSILVLNPDLVVEPGCLLRLRERMRTTGAGLVVPRILEADGGHFISLRREPTVARAVGDAAFGVAFGSRPTAWSEWVLRPDEYAAPHRIEWATGAALLIDARVADEIGSWDERFFLYSEETDYFRRVREAGYHVWYEPAAVVRHSRHGSGVSMDLERLIAVNRLRYMRKHASPLRSAIYRGVIVMHQIVRADKPVYRAMLRAVVFESSWTSLPRARRYPPRERYAQATGVIIIDARDRESDVERVLKVLRPFTAGSPVGIFIIGDLKLAHASRLDPAALPTGVTIIDDPPVGRTLLDVVETVSGGWPRVVVDARADVSSAAILDTLDFLRDADLEHASAHPPTAWDVAAASWVVRSYLRARARVCGATDPVRDTAVSGFTAGDHGSAASQIVETDLVLVPAPRTTRALFGTLKRTGAVAPPTRPAGARAGALAGIFGTVRGPFSLVDAAVFTLLTTVSRSRRTIGHES